MKIFGPAGNPGAKPKPTRYTLVPWEIIREEDKTKSFHEMPSENIKEPHVPAGGWNLTDRDAVLGEWALFQICRFQTRVRAYRLFLSRRI